MQVWAMWGPLLHLGFYNSSQTLRTFFWKSLKLLAPRIMLLLPFVTLAAGEGAVTALAEHAAHHWTQLHSLRLRHTRLGDAEVMVLQQRVAQEWPGVAEAMRF
jgi:hypothetical protein